MRVSAKGDYACRAMLDMVINRASDRPVQIQEIAQRQNIPIKFLEQILVLLKKEGLLESRRGPGGGYLLARNPADITVADVLKATDGPLFSAECSQLYGDDPATACPMLPNCVLHPVWDNVAKKVSEVLESVDFEQLAERYTQPKATMYYI